MNDLVSELYVVINIKIVTKYHVMYKPSLYIGPEGSRSLRLEVFSDSRHLTLARLQFYTPAAFTTHRHSLIIISVRG
jgi:hypothetical protein